MSNIVTVQDYLLKKDPEKYGKLFGTKKEGDKEIAFGTEQYDKEVHELLVENQELEKENKELVDKIMKIEKDSEYLLKQNEKKAVLTIKQMQKEIEKLGKDCIISIKEIKRLNKDIKELKEENEKHFKENIKLKKENKELREE